MKTLLVDTIDKVLFGHIIDNILSMVTCTAHTLHNYVQNYMHA